MAHGRIRNDNTIQYVECDVSGWVISSTDNGWYYKEAVVNVTVPTNAEIVSLMWTRNWDGGVFPFVARVIRTGTDAGKIKLTIMSNKNITLGSNRIVRCYYYD